MHEFSVAAGIIEKVNQVAASKGGSSVESIRLRIGVCTCICPESLEFALEILARDTPAQGCTVQVIRVPARGVCQRCGWLGTVSDPLQADCPDCGAVPVTLLSGRDFVLESITVN